MHTHSASFCPLPDFGAIAIDGADAGEFLQGQCSNDVERVSDTVSQLSTLCTPQGRVITVMRLLQTGGSFLLIVPRALHERVLTRLRGYVLRASVELTDRSAPMAGLGVAGDGAADALTDAGLEVPRHVDGVSFSRDLQVLRAPGAEPRFELYGERRRIETLREAFSETLAGARAALWHRQNVAAGIASLDPRTAGTFTPQMLNLDLLGAVSFTKGCYTGQEVIARTHNLGRVKRRMLRFGIDTEQQPQSGDPLFRAREKTGRIADVAALARGGYEILAVVPLADAGEPLHLDRDGGTLLQARPLPYVIPEM